MVSSRVSGVTGAPAIAGMPFFSEILPVAKEDSVQLLAGRQEDGGGSLCVCTCVCICVCRRSAGGWEGEKEDEGCCRLLLAEVSERRESWPLGCRKKREWSQ